MNELLLLDMPEATIAAIGLGDAPIAVLRDSRRGRYAVASRDIVQGECVLECRNAGIAIFQKCRKHACGACMSYTIARSSLPISQGCERCSSISYCGESCRAARSAYHDKFECAYLADISNGLPVGAAFGKWLASVAKSVQIGTSWSEELTDGSGAERAGKGGNLEPLALLQVYDRSDIQTLARWCLSFALHAKLHPRIAAGASAAHRRHPHPALVRELVPNVTSFPREELAQLYLLHAALLRIPPSSSSSSSASRPSSSLPRAFRDLISETFPTRQSFATVLATRQCNAFGLYDDGHEELGLALFPAGSYFNHACESNVGRDVMIRCVDGREGEGGGLVERDALDGLVEAGDEDDGEARAILRAWDREPLMRFVAARDVRRGEELTLSYVDVAQGRDARRKSLKDVYYFDCECARCEREKET